jgi:hypothetical protein
MIRIGLQRENIADFAVAERKASFRKPTLLNGMRDNRTTAAIAESMFRCWDIPIVNGIR